MPPVLGWKLNQSIIKMNLKISKKSKRCHMSLSNLKHDDPVLRYIDVTHQTGLSRSTIIRLINKGDFPKPIQLGERSVGFLSSEVQAWKEKRIALSRSQEVA